MSRGSKPREFNRTHLIAVRLVDAINREGVRLIRHFVLIRHGFRCKTRKIWVDGGLESIGFEGIEIHLHPAGWADDGKISCVLVQNDGYVEILNGKLNYHRSEYSFDGYDGRGPHSPQQDAVTISLTLACGPPLL